MISSTPPPAPRQVTQLSNAASALIILFFVAVTVVPVGYFLVWPNYVRSQLLKNGLQAEGTIVRIEPTGTYVNDQPQARITVEVRPTEGQPFQAETKMVINALYVPLYQPGKRVLVRYDENDHTKMTIEYTEGP